MGDSSEPVGFDEYRAGHDLDRAEPATEPERLNLLADAVTAGWGWLPLSVRYDAARAADAVAAAFRGQPSHSEPRGAAAATVEINLPGGIWPAPLFPPLPPLPPLPYLSPLVGRAGGISPVCFQDPCPICGPLPELTGEMPQPGQPTLDLLDPTTRPRWELAAWLLIITAMAVLGVVLVWSSIP